jgi:hypothetical protein
MIDKLVLILVSKRPRVKEVLRRHVLHQLARDHELQLMGRRYTLSGMIPSDTLFQDPRGRVYRIQAVRYRRRRSG